MRTYENESFSKLSVHESVKFTRFRERGIIIMFMRNYGDVQRDGAGSTMYWCTLQIEKSDNQTEKCSIIDTIRYSVVWCVVIIDRW